MRLRGKWHEGMVRIAVLVTTIVLAGCGESAPESVGDGEEDSGLAAAVGDSVAGSEVTGGDSDGALTVVVSQGTNLSFDVSPAADWIAMSVQGVLFTLPAAGGSARAITDYYQDVREPVWSPDGTTIAYYGYRNGNWDLWSISAQGGEPEQLTSDLFDDREPRYSPDGTRIAFSSDRSGNYDVWVLDLSDGSLTQVTEGAADEYSPDWSEDGARLAYAATTGRSASEVHFVDLASLDTQLVVAEPGVVSGVAWRGVDRLSYQLSGAAQTELRTVAIGGGDVDVLSDDGDDVFPFKAHWAGDGSAFYAANGRIYYQPLAGAYQPLAGAYQPLPGVRQPAGAPRAEIPFSASFELQRPSYERRRRNHDDTAPQPVLGISTPALSPDGEWVSFAALGDLWMWRPADETLSNLTESPFVARTPAWSPDGRQIAYISDKPANDSADSNGANTEGLWIYDIEQQISSRVSVNAPGASGPSWSPDGQSVAVFTSVPGNPLAGQMIVINLRDGSATPVHKPVPAQPISWSADGAYVATTELAPFSSRYREGVYRLAVMSPDSDERYEIEPVAHRNITSAALTPTGRAMTYVQDGLLWQQNLNENFEPQDAPVALTDSLTDTPSWSGDGRFVVYMDADRMFKLDVAANLTTDITPSLTWRASIPDERWTLIVGRLFDGISDDYLENVLITIDGNRIVSMEPGAAGRAADVDASDKAAYPGLFEMHAHMGETSESQGRTWLAYGITNVRDPGAHPYVAKERQEMWDSGKSIGPRTYTTGFLADGNRVYYSVAEGITSDEHLERALNRAQRLKLDFIKTYVRLPDLWQRRVVEFAHGIGIPTSSHELFPAVAHGMDHVEHIGGTSRRGFAPKVSGLGYSYDDVVNLLADSGMGITPTAVLPGYAVIAETQPDLFTTAQFETFYGERGRQGAAMMARMFGPRAGATVAANAELLRELAARDALMVSGTDSPFSPYGAGLHAELRLYALAGLTPQQVLRTATVKAAIAAGVENDLGTLRPGMLADMVIVDGDPLADIADADNVTMTIKNGRAYPLAELLAEPEAD